MAINSTQAHDCATDLTTNDDAAILAAWERISEARAVYDKLPDIPGLPIGDYTPAEQEQWDIIDAAEALIKDAVATTPEATEIQLWTSLSHSVTGWDDERAARERNLEFFLADGCQLDWNERFIIAAIRSLRAMQEGGAA